MNLEKQVEYECQKETIETLLKSLRTIYNAIDNTEDAHLKGRLLSAQQHTQRALHYMLDEPGSEAFRTFVEANTGHTPD